MSDFVFLQEPGDPTLVMLHGTGGDERDMMQFGRSLRSEGMGLLSPRGKEPERGMNRWFRRLAEGVFDLDNLAMRADELADFVVEKVPGRRVAVGFSNGANVAAAILLRSAPNSSIAARVARITPEIAPFHPACAAPITRAPASANSTGAQSAVRMPSAMPGVADTSASPSGMCFLSSSAVAPMGQALVTVTTWLP